MSRGPSPSTIEANCTVPTSIPNTICPTIIPSSSLQIPRKLFMEFLQTQISKSQSTFAILSNKEFQANIRPNFSFADLKQSQSDDLRPRNSFAINLAPFTSTLAEKSRLQQRANEMQIQQPNSKPIGIRPFDGKIYPRASANLPQLSANINNNNKNLSSAAPYHDLCKNWILRSIDQLKENKLRPDAERISKLMKLYCNINHEDTIKCLEELTDAGLVARVEYMRDITYQNPFRVNVKREIDKENMNPENSLSDLISQTSDNVELTKTQLKRFLDRGTAELSRVCRVDSVGKNYGNETNKDYEIPHKKAAFCHKSNPDEPTTISPFHHVCSRQTSPYLAFPASHLSSLDDQSCRQILDKLNISHASSAGNNCQTTSFPSTSNSMFPHLPIDVTKRSGDINYKSTSISVSPQTSARSTANAALKSAIKTTSQSEKPTSSKNVSFNTCDAEILTPKIFNSLRQQKPTESSIVIAKENVDNNCITGNDLKEEIRLQSGISTIIQSLSSTVLSTPQTATTSASVDQKSTTKPSKRGRPFGSSNEQYKISEIDCSCAKKVKLEENHQSTNKVANSPPCPLQQQTVNASELCIECGRPENIGEIYMRCASCYARAHTSCLRYSPELTEIFRKIEWNCDKCEAEIKRRSIFSLKEKFYACEQCNRIDKAVFQAPCRQYPLCLEPTWLCVFCYVNCFQSRFGRPIRQLSVVNREEMQESYKENCSGNIATQNQLNMDKFTVKQESFLSMVNEDLPSREEEQQDEMMKGLTIDNCEVEGLTLQSEIFREEDVHLDDPSLLFMEQQRDVLTEFNFNVGASKKKSFQ